MKTASRLFELAAAHPGEAVADVLGLVAICAMVFGGFVATAMG